MSTVPSIVSGLPFEKSGISGSALEDVVENEISLEVRFSPWTVLIEVISKKVIEMEKNMKKDQ
jgi:hypothetical protein